MPPPDPTLPPKGLLIPIWGGLDHRWECQWVATLNPVKPSPLMTPPLSTSWIPILPLTLSINPTSTMCLNTDLLIMALLLIGEPMVAFLDLM